MPDHFHLVAIVKRGSKFSLSRVPIDRDAQISIGTDWRKQYEDFTNETQEVSFSAGYTPTEGDRFVISDFDLPPWFSSLVPEDTSTQSPLTDTDLFSVSGMIGILSDHEPKVLLFQDFSKSKVISSKTLWWSKTAYAPLGRPALVLARKLSAVYYRSERRLLFRNFRTVNSFLPLLDRYWEASEEQIRTTLQNPLFDAEDVDAIAHHATQWFARRFAILEESRILKTLTTAKVTTTAKQFNVSVAQRNGKIVFPSDRGEAKSLLQLLCEEVFLGPISDVVYETNSKKRVE